MSKRKVQNKFVGTKVLAQQNKSIATLTIGEGKQNGTSPAWQHYGILCDSDGNKIDDTRYYCKLCLSAQQALLASGKSAHLSKVHNISLNTSSGNIKVHL